jgi:hypothetical protein
MKGFIVRSTTWEGETCKVAIPHTGVTITVNATWHSGAYWSIGGSGNNARERWYWKGGMLKPGDVIEIVCAEIDAYDPPCAKEEKNMYTTATDIDPVLRERMLQRYYRLKKILEEEGLL